VTTLGESAARFKARIRIPFGGIEPVLKKRDRFNDSSVQYIAERFHPGLHVDEGDLNGVRHIYG